MSIYFKLYRERTAVTLCHHTCLTSYLSEMQSVQKIHCLYSALSFCVRHLVHVG